MNACLSPHEVEAFVAGALSPADAAGCEAHAATCTRCREAIDHCRQHGTPTPPDPDMTHTMDGPTDAVPPDLIEGYEILHELHRGGQGVVYKAVQLATKRTIALKVLLQGPFATARQQHRFEREIDLVASIQHPNIITVYDSGMAQGRYYFAMEYVHGDALDVYLARTSLDLRAKLRLFRQICDAVNAAHRHGVIHRDLKPANICVDADGKPHVLDFGLAKAAGPDLEDGIPVTMTGEFMGTLAYASPEQTSGDPRAVDTRTDVYSLGVILYEMLTDELPYESTGTMAEILRNISEAQPRRPSGIRHEIDGEAETIVLKALAKEKDRRYQSAEALARDVRHYLDGGPLDAKRDSTLYLLRKSLRRYRFAAGAIAAIVVILVASTIGLSVLYRNQKLARQEAEAAQTEARARASELEIVTEFQQSMLADIDGEAMGRELFDDLARHAREELAAADLTPEEIDAAAADFDAVLERINATDVAMEMLDRQVLARSTEAIESEFAGQPVIRADLQQTVAEIYYWMGRYPPAMPLQDAALRTRRAELGDDHPETLVSMNNMGRLLEAMGRFDEAYGYYAETLAVRRRVLGDDDPETLASMNNLALLLDQMERFDEAHTLYIEALAGQRRVLGDDHSETLITLLNLGALLETMGQNDEALDHYQQALAGNRRVLGDDHPETLTAMNNLANLLHAMGRDDEALQYHREVLAVQRRIKGDDHPLTLLSINNLGGLMLSLQRHEEALAYFQEALAGWRLTLGNDHPNTLVAVAYVGITLKRLGRLDEAEPYYRESLAGNRRTLGDDHSMTVIAVHNMGKLLRDLGRLEEAEANGAHAVAWGRENLPEGHARTASFLMGHGMTLVVMGRFADAEAELLEAHASMATARGESHRRTVEVARELAVLYEAWHAAEPGGGHDAAAREWRDKLPNDG